MRIGLLAGLAVAFVLTPRAAARAQVVRGTVHDSASAAPLAGAVVSLVDTAGGVVARTMADAAGRFSLSSSPRGVRLRVIRIGYQPRDIPLPQEPATLLAFGMVRLPPMLDAVRVSDRELCPGSTDRGAAFQLWEQARAGLLATVVARETNPANAIMMTFDRTFVPDERLIRRLRTSVKAGHTTKAFVTTVRPAAFAVRGYVTEERDGSRMYSAPDEDVLLDESFARTHCFHLEAGSDLRRNQIGLAFTPLRDHSRDTLVDVRGVIWMDRDTPALRTLEFRYTGLEPAAERAETGGYMEFQSMANGVTFIEYWQLRLPLMSRPVQPARDPSSLSSRPANDRRTNRFDARVVQIQETGGEVLDARWPGGERWNVPPTGIVGTVMQRGTQSPSQYTIVGIPGSGASTVTNERGEYSLTPLPAGTYSVQASDTSLQRFAGTRTMASTVVVERGHLSTARMEVPRITDLLADICRSQPIPRGHSTIVGALGAPGGVPFRGASVKATWAEDIVIGSAGSGDAKRPPVAVRSREQTSDVDATGRFVVCGVPTERTIQLRFTDPTRSADTTVVVYDTLMTYLRWSPRVP